MMLTDGAEVVVAAPGNRSRRGGRVAAGLVLSGLVIALVVSHGGSVAACVAATAMTAPVAFARRAPIAAAVILAGAAAGNELFFGHLIRCGATLPAVFYVAYVAGAAVGGWACAIILSGVTASVVIQCVFDPQLGAGVIPLMLLVSGVFFGGGVLVRRRAALVARLRRDTEALRAQGADRAVRRRRRARPDQHRYRRHAAPADRRDRSA